MKSKYFELRTLAALERSADPGERYHAQLIAKHFEKLLKRQESETVQLRALRRDLETLPAGPLREQIAAEILAYVESQQNYACRIAERTAQQARGKEQDPQAGA